MLRLALLQFGSHTSGGRMSTRPVRSYSEGAASRRDAMKNSAGVSEWLLGEDQPAVRYFALTELLERKPDDPEVKEAYTRIPKEGWAADVLRLQRADGRWESRPKGSLYGPKYTATNWMALVLSDLGLTKATPQIRKAANLFFREWMPLPSMENIFNDEVCIVGNTARMLTRFGYADDHRVRKLFDRLVEDQKEDGGWHCFKSDTGTLDCWEAMAAYAALPRQKRTRSIGRSIERGAEFYLERRLFDEGGETYAPWLRFHYPNHYYYDILVGMDVLARLGYAGDRRLKPALKILDDKQLPGGAWALDRVHPDLGPGAKYSLRKKPKRFSLESEGKPSKWITLKALTVRKRVEEASGQG